MRPCSAPRIFPVIAAFGLELDLNAVEKQVEMKTSEAKLIHQRPAVMQDFEWRPRSFPSPSGELDPVKDVLLSFYNGQLFRIVASYDRYRTEGMTAQDMIDAISATYGLAAKPTAEILFPSLCSEKVKVIARWEDSEYSLNLVNSHTSPALRLFRFPSNWTPSRKPPPSRRAGWTRKKLPKGRPSMREGNPTKLVRSKRRPAWSTSRAFAPDEAVWTSSKRGPS